MNTFIDKELAQLKYKELLQEAAEARADRKAQRTTPSPVVQKFRLALVTVLPIAIFILWAFIK